MRYRLQWDRGPSAVIDVQQREDTFLLRYDGPFRLTLRRGLEELQVTPDDLAEPVTTLRRIAAATGLVAGRGGASAVAADEVLGRLVESGDNLCRTMLPRFVAADLSGESLFLEVGTDENLLPVPFELMRDETGFVCLRHAMGRYVNVTGPLDVGRRLDPEGEFRVLLVCAPKPQPVAGNTYERLAEAEAEFEAVSTLLVDRGVECRTLYGPDASLSEVRGILRGADRYTVIHFTGHGHVDENDPRRSGLVLFDGILSTGVIGNYLNHTPALAFINGCETARTTTAGDAGELPLAHLTRVFGIARPFLQQGSYVLGTRWRVSDTVAKLFAKEFYSSLLSGRPVGEAVREARAACYDPVSSDLSWASYVFYGDPRLVIRLEAVRPTGTARPRVRSIDSGLPAPLAGLATQYDQVRAEEPSAELTLAMEQLVQAVRDQAADVAPETISQALGSDTEGERLVGVAAARVHPDPGLAEPLIGILRAPRSDFEEYHVLKTLREVLVGFDRNQRKEVGDLLLERLGHDEFLTSDRAILARDTLGLIAPGT